MQNILTTAVEEVNSPSDSTACLVREERGWLSKKICRKRTIRRFCNFPQRNLKKIGGGIPIITYNRRFDSVGFETHVIF
jgi:hypothetical protein